MNEDFIYLFVYLLFVLVNDNNSANSASICSISWGHKKF